MMEKKRLREMTWEDYGISRHRYEELRAFCLQYEEKRREIAKSETGFHYRKAVSRTGTEDPAKRAALRRRRPLLTLTKSWHPSSPGPEVWRRPAGCGSHRVRPDCGESWETEKGLLSEMSRKGRKDERCLQRRYR